MALKAPFSVTTIKGLPLLAPGVNFSHLPSNKRSRIMCGAFAEGCGGQTISLKMWFDLWKKNQNPPKVAIYGVLYGAYMVIENSPNYWHIDHGYFKRSKNPDIFKGYYRINKNSLWNNGSGDSNWDRFNSLNIKLKDWRKTGNHIVIVPPSKHMTPVLNMETWLEETIFKVKKYTDRKILVSTKYKNPMSEVMKNAWAVITDHSNSAIDAMIEGIPAIFTNPARRLGSIEQIEDPPMDRDFFKNLAHQQWTLEEIKTGKAWLDLNG
ncbi:hypothetical protein CL634_08905 [bacterium]|nr:hypothetical protein [bacterium]